MARDFPAYFQTQDVAALGSGAVVANGPETVIQQNINWLQATMVRPLINDVFGTAANNPWLDVSTGNDGSATRVACYRVRVPRDFVTYRVHARVKNAHASSTGLLGMQLTSDSTINAVTIPANTTGTSVTFDLAVNTAVALDTLNFAIQNGASDSAGVCSIQSVTVYAVPLATPLPAGESTKGFIPIDGTEVQSNAPMSTHLRNTEHASLEALTKKRTASVLLSWSDNIDNRVPANTMFLDASTAYTLIAQIPIYVPRGLTRIEWAVQGYTTSGAGGTIKVTTLADPTGVESAAFGNAWTAGDANTARWQDNGDELEVLENSFDTMRVYLRDGSATSTTYLTALSLWLKEG